MVEENSCPVCGPVGDEVTSRYCTVHRDELLAECATYVADLATVRAAPPRMKAA